MKRHTVQNEFVLEAVQKLGCHATADEVYEAVHQQHANISRGTVYRNLTRLCEEGKIRKIEIPDGADCYDHHCTNHYHVKCIQCGRLFDVDMEYIENLEHSITDSHGFIFTDYDILFKGICPVCQKTRSV